MTLYQFNSLDEAEQHETLWEHGVIVGERTDGTHKIILYQLFSFYAELYYHIEYNVLRRLRSFSSAECLEEYIKDFKLPDIN